MALQSDIGYVDLRDTITQQQALCVDDLIEVAQIKSIRGGWETTLSVSNLAHQYASDRIRRDSDMQIYCDDSVIYTGLLDDGSRWRVRLLDPD